MLLSEVLNKFYVLPLNSSEIVGFDAVRDTLHISWTDSDSGRDIDQYFPDQEIQSSTILAQGAFNVTDNDGKVACFIALDGAVLKPERLVVVLEGGLVQGVLSETTAMELVVIDYDTEGASEDEICTIPQYGGGTAQATTCLQTTEVYPKSVQDVFDAIGG